jgi:uncharacterized membrane protein
MASGRRAWTDDQVESIVGTLLRWGVTISAVVVLAGGLLYLIRYGFALPDYRVFRGEPSDLRMFSGIVGDALALKSRGIMQLGLLLLIATPVARVSFAVLAFCLQRDRTYVLVTLIVLLALVYSIAGGYL